MVNELLSAVIEKAEEETVILLNSQNESEPLTYLMTRVLNSLREESRIKRRVRATIPKSRRELGKILNSTDRWTIWTKIYELKATCNKEVQEVLGSDPAATSRTIRALRELEVIKVSNKLTHPRGRGNETEIISLIDAAPEFSLDAANRARRIVGKRGPKIIQEVKDERSLEEIHAEATGLLLQYRAGKLGPVKYQDFRNWLREQGYNWDNAKDYAERMLKVGSVTL